MKNEFFGFYEASSAEIDKSWKESYFVFDASTLLNLYRYSDSTRKDFLSAIHKLKENLFMPYQVGFEYHSNRLNVIDTLNSSYASLKQSVNEIFEKQIKSQVNQYKRHPSINVDSLLKLQNEFLQNFKIELEKQKEEHPDFVSEDEVLNKLTEFYENKVGKSFSKDELKKIYLEGKDRYEQLVPPGYKDLETKRKKGDQHIYGDLIIWKEIIAFTKKEKKSIIFVTDDRKEDWWTIENGKTIRPREELIKEFYDLTGIRILIYNADNFLHHAKERNLVSTIKEASINEVKEVRKADENLNSINEFLNFSKLSDFLNRDSNKISGQLNDLIDYNPSRLNNFLYLDPSKMSSRLNDLINYNPSKLNDFLYLNPDKLQGQLNDMINYTSSKPNNFINSDPNKVSSQFKDFINFPYSKENDIINPNINRVDLSLPTTQNFPIFEKESTEKSSDSENTVSIDNPKLKEKKSKIK